MDELDFSLAELDLSPFAKPDAEVHDDDRIVCLYFHDNEFDQISIQTKWNNYMNAEELGGLISVLFRLRYEALNRETVQQPRPAPPLDIETDGGALLHEMLNLNAEAKRAFEQLEAQRQARGPLEPVVIGDDKSIHVIAYKGQLRNVRLNEPWALSLPAQALSDKVTAAIKEALSDSSTPDDGPLEARINAIQDRMHEIGDILSIRNSRK